MPGLADLGELAPGPVEPVVGGGAGSGPPGVHFLLDLPDGVHDLRGEIVELTEVSLDKHEHIIFLCGGVSGLERAAERGEALRGVHGGRAGLVGQVIGVG